MKLIEALNILQAPVAQGAEPRRYFLATGFMPLHLATLLKAQLRLSHPGVPIELETGLFDDLEGSVQRIARPGIEAAAIVLEWPDLDPRLGIRSLGKLGLQDVASVVSEVSRRITHLRAAIQAASAYTGIALGLPSLPLEPLPPTPSFEAPPAYFELEQLIAGLGLWAAGQPRVRVLHPRALRSSGEGGERFDAKAELGSGFPYRVSHASALAEGLARLMAPPVPKKGLITDLDNTLWKGVVGEIGAAGVAWDLEHKAQLHGMYQRALAALAESGVLIAAASRNDPAAVGPALAREDMVLPLHAVFPIEASWGPKSEAVSRILKTWNVSADAVVFVDDSAMEVAEVQSVHPGIECLRFPSDDSQAAHALVFQLWDLFGKHTVSAEDGLRLDSIRANVSKRAEETIAGPSDDFLATAQAVLSLSFGVRAPDPRALELINKTNQFNLNGRRHSEASWLAELQVKDRFLLVASYKDRFGPLGKIAVLSGRKNGRALQVDHWVMSCRAFARRIEHACVMRLFERFDVDEIGFEFVATERNGPIREYLESLSTVPLASNVRLSKLDFLARCPRLFHSVQEVEDE